MTRLHPSFPQLNPFVAACIVTYRRDAELARLLAGLADCGPALGAVIVVDNAAADRGSVSAAAVPGAQFQFIALGSENSGPGAGWRRGMEEALVRFADRLTHFWLLDDDVVASRETLDRLLSGLATARAEVAVPLITDRAGRIWGFPEPVDPVLRETIRRSRTPAEAVELLGRAPLEFCWASGTCVLLTRTAVERVGLHRTDFRILGEDLEYSMRLSAQVRCVFLPDVTVPHLPGEPVGETDRAGTEERHRAKFLALLQNLSYLAFHSPHSRHLWRYLPGNYRRFFRTEGLSPATVAAAAAALWHGAIRGRPAGWRDAVR